MSDFVIIDGVLKEYTGKDRDLIIPDGVTSIDKWVFQGRRHLETVTIPDGVTKIGDSAFWNCAELRHVTMPDSVTELGEGVFSDCVHLERIRLSKGVTVISKALFSGCSSLQEIEIPDNVTQIGYSAFYHCETLRNVTIPDSVEVIGVSAFFECNRLQCVTIGKGVREISMFAFADCENLEKILLPENLTNIETQAFRGCERLADDNGMVIINHTLFDYFGTSDAVIIPDTVNIIDSEAFRGAVNLKSLTVPDSVTKIRNRAFQECDQLQNVTVGSHITQIGEHPFDGCKRIRRFILAPDLTDEQICRKIVDRFETKRLMIPFLSGNMETNEIIRNILKTEMEDDWTRRQYANDLIANGETEAMIGLLSLFDWMALEEIDSYLDLSVKKGTVEITVRLMEYRRQLYPPETIAKLQEQDLERMLEVREKTFADYRNDFKIYRSGLCFVITACKTRNAVVEIPGTIKGRPVSISTTAFSSCDYIRDIYITDGLTAIGPMTFRDCTALQTIEIPDSVTEIEDDALPSSEDLIIRASEGSYAHQFAIRNQIHFQAI